MKLSTIVSGGLAIILGVAGCSSDMTSAPSESTAKTDEALYGLGAIGGRWPNGIVPVCFTAESVQHPDLVARIPNILALSWGRSGNVTFTGFGACSGDNEVMIGFWDHDRSQTDAWGYGHRYITLEQSASADRFTYSVIHEMGHALGFAHEQQRPDNWPNGPTGQPMQCPPGSDSVDQYLPMSNGIYLTSTYDVASVMNYCAPNNGTVLSAGDIAGFSRPDAYGPAWLTTSPQTLTITAGDSNGANIAIGTGKAWTPSGPISFSITDLPAGVKAIPLDTYGSHYNLFSLNGTPGTYTFHVNGQIGSTLHSIPTSLTINPKPVVIPPTPQLGLTLDSLFAVTARSGSSGMLASTNGTPGGVTFSTGTLPYGLKVLFSPNPTTVGQSISMGFWPASDATIGTFPVTIIATANGVTATRMMNVEVDACQPVTCGSQCGTIPNGCGGTLECAACCTTPQCQCEDSGGKWLGGTCHPLTCSTPAQCCAQEGGTWHLGHCL